MARPASAPSKRVEDDVWVRRFQAGERREDAFLELFERYVDVTHAFFRRRVGDPELAAELNQDLHLTVYDTLDGFRSESSYRTWLFRLAHNRLHHLRRRLRVHLDERPVEVEDAFFDELGGGADDAGDALHRKRVAYAVRRCLAELTDVERAIVLGQYWQGATLDELSRALKLPNKSGARAPLIAAQRKMKRCVERSGVSRHDAADGGAR